MFIAFGFLGLVWSAIWYRWFRDEPSEHPEVNSYMFNGSLALPFGPRQTFQPYFSGGLGGIQMHTSVLTFANGVATGGNEKNSQTRLGYNLGAGLIGFAGNWGAKLDFRWYTATKFDPLSGATPAQALTRSLVSGIDYWRTDIGLAYRF